MENHQFIVGSVFETIKMKMKPSFLVFRISYVEIFNTESDVVNSLASFVPETLQWDFLDW